jgi:hypothetical protein
MTIYQAIQEVIRRNRNKPMSFGEIADEINRLHLCTKRNGSEMDSMGVALTVWDYSEKTDHPLFNVRITNSQ